MTKYFGFFLLFSTKMVEIRFFTTKIVYIIEGNYIRVDYYHDNSRQLSQQLLTANKAKGERQGIALCIDSLKGIHLGLIIRTIYLDIIIRKP